MATIQSEIKKLQKIMADANKRIKELEKQQTEATGQRQTKVTKKTGTKSTKAKTSKLGTIAGVKIDTFEIAKSTPNAKKLLSQLNIMLDPMTGINFSGNEHGWRTGHIEDQILKNMQLLLAGHVENKQKKYKLSASRLKTIAMQLNDLPNMTNAQKVGVLAHYTDTVTQVLVGVNEWASRGWYGKDDSNRLLTLTNNMLELAEYLTPDERLQLWHTFETYTEKHTSQGASKDESKAFAKHMINTLEYFISVATRNKDNGKQA